ncbi:MAG: biopolymer transporter ExbD [Bacteroides sp.]|nr:biopolymer transporter ExbD [Bacteroides sp.]MDD2644708.1 biopolymer transporter ExbD [Bacteroides sp.]MDD4054545.1 biopolymer transporter ExbD [Bacteroides sp.]MDD4720031.1 biopolymer transporter ExbD [Bacteroides sp.]
MAKGNRKVPDINSSSTADIAFLLLIFFLITTSMDTDSGLARQLPPPPEPDQEEQDIDIKERNILIVLLNAQNQLMVGGELLDITQLNERAKEFIQNPQDKATLPEKTEIEVPYFGKVVTTANHVISLMNDRGTSYQAYIDVQNELVRAYNELRDDIALSKWHVRYEELNEDQKSAIREIYPQRISEAEPRNYGGKK